MFFEEIYSKFEIQRVYASRSVNANATKRGKLSELLICNYMSEKEYKSKHLELTL